MSHILGNFLVFSLLLTSVSTRKNEISLKASILQENTLPIFFFFYLLTPGSPTRALHMQCNSSTDEQPP